MTNQNTRSTWVALLLPWRQYVVVDERHECHSIVFCVSIKILSEHAFSLSPEPTKLLIRAHTDPIFFLVWCGQSHVSQYPYYSVPSIGTNAGVQFHPRHQRPRNPLSFTIKMNNDLLLCHPVRRIFIYRFSYTVTRE